MSQNDQQKLDTDVSIDSEPLTAAVGGDPDSMEVLGYATMYSVGDAVVPRDWLLRRMDDLSIPQWIAPNEPRPSSAYKRAMDRLINVDNDEHEFEVGTNGGSGTVEAELEVREGDGKYARHLVADVYWPPEMIGQDEGEWRTRTLGYYDYIVDDQKLTAHAADGIEEGDVTGELWSSFSGRAEDLFAKMKEHHIGHDIRLMLYYTTRDHTDSVVSLRDGGAVYFFPAALGDLVESLGTLLRDINREFKQKGVSMGIRTFPILDTEEQKDWIESRVRQSLEDNIDGVVEDALDQFSDGEKTAEEAVNLLRDGLGEDENTAEVYNDLLEVQLGLEEMLEDRKAEVDSDAKQEIIDRVIQQANLDEF